MEYLAERQLSLSVSAGCWVGGMARPKRQGSGSGGTVAFARGLAPDAYHGSGFTLSISGFFDRACFLGWFVFRAVSCEQSQYTMINAKKHFFAVNNALECLRFKELRVK